MRIFCLLFIITLLSSFSNFNEGPFYHEVAVRSGDGVLSLLRRYDLAGHECNLKRFYEINDMEYGETLKIGYKYKIPVLIYTYNGQSIRSSIGNNDWDKAKRIQAYNEQLVERGLRQSNYRTSKILWVPYHEMQSSVQSNITMVESKEINNSPEEKATKMISYPLLGKKHETFAKESDALKNKVFYVVAGHGGPDPGAMAYAVSGKYNLCEDEYAYDVALRLSRQLMKQGAKVHMIIEDPNDGIRSESYLDCDKDERCDKKQIPINQLARLKQRTDYINRLHQEYKRKGYKDQRVISIHVDSRSQHKRQDVFFYYYAKSNTGKKIAKNIHNTFKAKYKKYQSRRGYHGSISARPLYVLRKTNPPAVFVELANIRNAHDRKRILLESNREALAKWLAEGLAL